MEVEIGDSIAIITWESSRSGNLIMKPCKTAAANRWWGIQYILREMKRALISNCVNGVQRKRENLLLLGFRNTPFQISPAYGIKRIVNILRRFNTSNLFLVMKVPIFAAHCQKRKLHFYGNSRENKGGREVPCKQAHRHTGAALPACCKEAPTRWHSFHKNTWICRSSWWLIRRTCWVADATITLLFDFQI